MGKNCPQVSVIKTPDFKTNTGALQHIGFDPDFWISIPSICSLHSRMSCFLAKPTSLRLLNTKIKTFKNVFTVKTFKNVFRNNSEKLELSNSFQNYFLIIKVPPPNRCRSGPTAARSSPCYATATVY